MVFLLWTERGDEGACARHTQHGNQEEGVPGDSVPDKHPDITRYFLLEEVGLSEGDGRDSDRKDGQRDEQVGDVDEFEEDVADVGFVTVFQEEVAEGEEVCGGAEQAAAKG